MEIDGIEVLELELKYCERCGGLWLRVRRSEQIYCQSCIRSVAELPRVKERRRLKAKPSIQSCTNASSVEGAIGGNA